MCCDYSHSAIVVLHASMPEHATAKTGLFQTRTIYRDDHLNIPESYKAMYVYSHWLKYIHSQKHNA